MPTYNQVIVYGQSLSVGGQSGVARAITTTQSYGNVMLPGGLRSDPYEAGGLNQNTFAPLVEAIGPVSGLGETPTGGLTDMVSQLILADGGAEALAAYKMVGTNPGYTSLTLAELSLDTAPFLRMLQRIHATNRIANDLGASAAAQAMALWQGEEDYQEGTTRAAYLALLRQLYADFVTYSQQHNPQSITPQLLIAQLASHLPLGVTNPTIALAQLDAMLADPTHICIAAPQYIGDHEDGNVHPWPSTHRWMGAYVGVAYWHRIVKSDGWLPLYITSAVRDATGITLSFHIPTPPLVLDTTWVTALADGNYGFQVVDSGGNPVAITSTTLINSDTQVRLACADGGSAGSMVRAAWAGTAGKVGRSAGARCNLRDSAGDALTFAIEEGDVRPMHNWLVISEVATT